MLHLISVNAKLKPASASLGGEEATRKGQVLTLLAEQALQCLDFRSSYSHCQELMAAGRKVTMVNNHP